MRGARVTLIVGIDLGVSGAVARVDHHLAADVEDLPILVDERGKRLDSRAFVLLMRKLVPANETALVVMEDVRVRAARGRPMSHHNEGVLVGVRFGVHAVLDLMGWRVEFVQPQTWKRHYGLLLKKEAGETDYQYDRRKKDRSMERARVLFPGLSGALARAKDHNRSEALLIARYGQKEFA